MPEDSKPKFKDNETRLTYFTLPIVLTIKEIVTHYGNLH